MSGMLWRWLARLIDDGAITTMVANVRRRAARVPIEKKAWPAVMMQRLGLADGRHRHFEHAHERVLKNHPVTVRRGLHGVEAVGESGFVLGVEIKMAGKKITSVIVITPAMTAEMRRMCLEAFIARSIFEPRFSSLDLLGRD